jgi:hypothetical protein
MCVAWPILPELVQEVWPSIEARIADALAYAQGENTTSDVRQRVLSGSASLWLMIEPEGPVRGVMVAEIIGYPQQRVANAWLLAGEHQETWMPVADEKLEAWARQRGCVAITGDGRRGWRPILDKLGSRVVAWKYRKDLES